MENTTGIKILMRACETALKNDQFGAVMKKILTACEDDNINDAINHAKKALLLNPNHLDPMVVLGVLLLEQSQRTAAINYFKQVTTQDPNNSLALWFAAYDALYSGNAVEALALLKSAIECKPIDPYVVITHAWLLLMLGCVNDAKELIYSKLLIESNLTVCTTSSILFTDEAAYLNSVKPARFDRNASCLFDLIHIAENPKYQEIFLEEILNKPNNNLLSRHNSELSSNCIHIINPALDIYKSRYGNRICKSYVERFFKTIVFPEIKRVLRDNKMAQKKQSPSKWEIPPDMVVVPAGEYTIGTNVANLKHPEKKYSMKTFLIDRYPVTNQEWQKFMPNHRFPKGQENFPVVNVDFVQATLYARWKDKRLPTETEWEAAARGTGGFKYPWGNNLDPARVNGAERRRRQLTAVTQHPRGVSACGAHDMLGNALEWVDTWGPSDNYRKYVNRVTKGGGFILPAASLACWLRGFAPPLSKGPNIGFRCVKDL